LCVDVILNRNISIVTLVWSILFYEHYVSTDDNCVKKIHVGAISSGRTKYIKPKLNHQKGICSIGILQLIKCFEVRVLANSG